MGLTPSLLRMIERKTGRSIGELQAQTISDGRREVEARHGAPMRFTREFPFIGRGSEASGRLMSHEEVEKEFRKAVR